MLKTKLKIWRSIRMLKKQTRTDIQFSNLLLCLILGINYFATEEGSTVETFTFKINGGFPTKVNMNTGEYTHYENEEI